MSDILEGVVIDSFDLATVAQGEGWTHTSKICRDRHCLCNGGYHEQFKGEYRGMAIKVTLHNGQSWSIWVEGFRAIFNVSYRELGQYVDRCAEKMGRR